MSKKNFAVTVVAVLLAIAVAGFAALNLVVGQRYTLTGTMSQCQHHPGTFFLNIPAAGSGGGSHSSVASDRAGSGTHQDTLRLDASAAAVNLSTVFASLKPNQKVSATGLYAGSQPSGHGENHLTLKTKKVVVLPLARQQAAFNSLYDVRRQ